MQVKSIAEGGILQYCRPVLSYHLSLRSLFCLFFSGRFTQILLYFIFEIVHELLTPFNLDLCTQVLW